MINADSFQAARAVVSQYLSHNECVLANHQPLDRELISDALTHYIRTHRSDEETELMVAQYPILLDCELLSSDDGMPHIQPITGTHHQRQHGAFYTPVAMINQILQHILTADHEPESICDPACGTGLFLTQAARLIAERRSRRLNEPYAASLHWVVCHAIYGAELDAGAAKLARSLLSAMDDHHPESIKALEAHIIHADALLTDWPRQFDTVVGNPPYIDSESMIRHQPETRRLISERYASATGNWDIYIPFVELAMKLTQPGGTFGLITPTGLLHARYATSIQKMILTQTTPTVYLDYSQTRPFDNASVEVGVLVCRKGSSDPCGTLQRVRYDKKLMATDRQSAPLSRMRQQPMTPMGAIWDIDEVSLRIAALPDRLGDYLACSDGASTGEAYQIAELLIDRDALPTDLRLVNTGTIDPYRLLWGVKPITYIKRQMLHPVVPAEVLRAKLPRRHSQAMQTKVVIAGLCTKLEAAVAPAGVLCGKSAVQAIPVADVCVYAVTAYLNSTPIRRYMSQMHGTSLTGKRGLQVTRRSIEAIPAPPLYLLADGSDLSQLGRQAHELGCGEQMQSAVDALVLGLLP
ncbi:MAG: HsdM family class I SAM-dependent methyltransferase [Armatimonadota bacterium]